MRLYLQTAQSPPTPIPRALSTALISSRIAGSSIVAGMFQGSRSAIFCIVPAQDLAGTCLRQAFCRKRHFESRHGTDLFANQGDAILLDLGVSARVTPDLSTMKPQGTCPFR